MGVLANAGTSMARKNIIRIEAMLHASISNAPGRPQAIRDQGHQG
jgi:hypothetical protein